MNIDWEAEVNAIADGMIPLEVRERYSRVLRRLDDVTPKGPDHQIRQQVDDMAELQEEAIVHLDRYMRGIKGYDMSDPTVYYAAIAFLVEEMHKILEPQGIQMTYLTLQLMAFALLRGIHIGEQNETR